MFSESETSDLVYLSENIIQMELNQLNEAKEKNDVKILQDVIKKEDSKENENLDKFAKYMTRIIEPKELIKLKEFKFYTTIT